MMMMMKEEQHSLASGHSHRCHYRWPRAFACASVVEARAAPRRQLMAFLLAVLNHQRSPQTQPSAEAERRTWRGRGELARHLGGTRSGLQP
jgi:hypothetical protein